MSMIHGPRIQGTQPVHRCKHRPILLQKFHAMAVLMRTHARICAGRAHANVSIAVMKIA